MYSVVEFRDGGVSTIPNKWLLKSGKECYWPPKSVDFVKAQAKSKTPDKKTWGRHKIKKLVAEKIALLSKALGIEQRYSENRKNYLDSTDYDTPSRKRKRVPPSKLRFSSESEPSAFGLATISPNGECSDSGSDPVESSDSSNENSESSSDESSDEDISIAAAAVALPGTSSSPHPLPPVRNQTPLRKTPANSAIAGPSTLVTPSPLPLVRSENTPLRSTPAKSWNSMSVDEKLDHLKYTQEVQHSTVIAALAEINVTLKDLLARSNGTTLAKREALKKKIPFSLPLQSKEDIKKLDKWLASVENQKIAAKYCSSFGGKKLVKAVRRILGELFTTNVARRINWLGGGKHKKKSLKNRKNIRQVIIDGTRSVKGHIDATEHDIEEIEKIYFRNSRDLNGGAALRKKEAKKKKKAKNDAGTVSDSEEEGA